MDRTKLPVYNVSSNGCGITSVMLDCLSGLGGKVAELIVCLIVLVVLVVLVYGVSVVIMLIGAMGWYLSYPILAVISLLLIAWPFLSYRKIRQERTWPRSFWCEETPKIVLIIPALLLIWGCALREQIQSWWDTLSPYLLH